MSSKKKTANSYPAKALTALAALAKSSVQVFDDIYEGVRDSTGFPSFDTILGGGLLRGRQVMFWGGESSGKTTLGLQCLSYRMDEGRFGLIIDFERTIMPSHVAAITGREVVQLKDMREWLEKHGAKHPPVVFFCQPANIEEMTDLMRGLSATFEGAFAWALLDSIPAAMPDAMIEAEAGQHFIGKQALMLTNFLNLMQAILPRHGTTLVLITQERKNIVTRGFGGMGPEFRPAGPDALHGFATDSHDEGRTTRLQDDLRRVVASDVRHGREEQDFGGSSR
jgi:RecA/RadA recombinase